jgi:transposase/transposase InsO family protein
LLCRRSLLLPTQLQLSFDDVPLSCPTQEKYHAIAPVLAGKIAPLELSRRLTIPYSTIMRWLQQFRQHGMPGLFPATEYPREPYTPERIIVTLLYYKCCARRASDRELARVIATTTGYRIHNETVKALLLRYPFWKFAEFRLRYPVSDDPVLRRMEMVQLQVQGWSEKTIAELLHCSPRTVRKWLRRAQQTQQGLESNQAPFPFEHSRAPHHTRRKVYFGAIHAVLELQKKYGASIGSFRIQGYLARDYGIVLGETTIKKIMKLNRQLHLAPGLPVAPIIKESREGPPKSQYPFQHVYLDLRYLDAKPQGVQLYSCWLIEGYSRTILAGSLTRRQDVGVVLRAYYLALLKFGCWEQAISDHGGQFQSHAFARVNRRLCIRHEMYEQGHPWQNLIESQFGIQARLGEYQWERCRSVDQAVEVHRELMRDYNRLPHFAHRQRNDHRHAPLEVLGEACGREVDAATLHRAFSRMTWQRQTDERGFVRINR